MIVFIPTNGPTHFEDRSHRGAKTYAAQQIDGRMAFDIPPVLFRSLLQGASGLAWENANPEACRELSQYR